MGKVIIMRGAPGSGKSTYTKEHFPDALVCSADNFFLKEADCDCGFNNDPESIGHPITCAMMGELVYKFDRTKIGEAHANCLKTFVDYIRPQDGVSFGNDIVVDNTNISAVEIAPYAALALAYGWELEIITLDVDPEVAHSRNVHGVPLGTVKDMHKRLEWGAKSFPPWWKHTIVKEG